MTVVMTILLWVAALMLLALTATPYAPRTFFYADLASHFVLQYLLGAAILCLIALPFRPGGGLFVVLFMAYALCIHQMWPYFKRDAAATPAATATFKLLQGNTLYSTGHTQALTEMIEKENPDIIVLAEVNRTVAAQLETLKNYPHRIIHPQDNTPFGLAVLSKIPLENVEEKFFATPYIPSLLARFQWQGQMITLAALHTANPLYDMAARDREFEMLAQWQRAEKTPHLIVAGDLNATPYCPALKKMTHETNLKNARNGIGIAGTFPSWLPTALLKMPIDHVLTSPELHVSRFEAVDIGSDHLGTVTVLNLSGPG